MKDLVFIKKEQVFTTSLKVAEIFEKRHTHVIRDIENLIAQMTSEPASAIESPKLGFLKNIDLSVSDMFKKTTYKVEGQIRSYSMYLINCDGFTLLAMGFTGQKALMFKLAYIDAFNKMHKILVERQTPEWQQSRTDSKISTRRLTDAIKNFLVPLAIKQGMDASKESFIYNNYNRLINKCAGVKADSRELLTSNQLYEMNKMSNIAGTLIEKYAVQEMDYHDIYFHVKDYIFEYIKISMF